MDQTNCQTMPTKRSSMSNDDDPAPHHLSQLNNIEYSAAFCLFSYPASQNVIRVRHVFTVAGAPTRPAEGNSEKSTKAPK